MGHLLFLRMELTKRLRIDTSDGLWVVNAPSDLATVLPNITTYNKASNKKPVKQLMLFAYNSSDFHKYLPKLIGYIAHNTLFWISYPKQSGSIESDLTKMEPWEYITSLGFRGQTSIHINNDWTGMRFTNAPRKKPSLAELPPEERKVEGIDFVNRTTTLPKDAKLALGKYNGLVAFFEDMAFTHRKEYIMAIVEAKKPETRMNRINKMVEMVQQLKEEKELKNKAKAKK